MSHDSLKTLGTSPFLPVDPRQNFPKLEEKILEFWRQERIFEKSLNPIDPAGKPRPQFVFYEGPPTANGKPGIHHVLSRAFKDVIPRYKTMRGYVVPRKAGWDCHGLPVEVEVEKRLGLRGKQQIEELGVTEFNRLCRQSVFQYIKDWDRLTERIGFWLDTERPYRTLDNDYIESCWALLQTLFARGLLVKDYKVTKHCPRCCTSLAEAEAGQGMKDDVDDPSVFVRLRLQPGQALPFDNQTTDTATSLLIWTTTPWTLPANSAAALNPKGMYALCVDPKDPQARLIVLASQAQTVLGDKKTTVEVLGQAAGAALCGLRYHPLYAGVGPGGVTTDLAHAYVSIVDDSVELGEGTGIVHIAPAYGDLDIGRRHGLPVLFSISQDGLVLPAFAPFAGKFFKEADPLITRDLKERGLLFSSGRVRHSYPFCWRCDTPLLYLAKESWYIKTTAVREELIAQNQRINWYPEHIKEGRFGDWLRNNVDWAISRERYWGTPLPLWQCDQSRHIECIGSIDELSQKVGRDLRLDADFDLHRPYIDQITWQSPTGGTMRRVRDVIDCWFDSGAMPLAQHHYMSEADAARTPFPAEFISEAVDQTRGWFYTLHALGVLLRGQPAFQNCIVLGHILDEQGRKMSKRLGNIVDPWSVLDVEGADALRYYLYTASPPGQPRRFSQALVQKSLRQFLLTLWNCYSFFVTYAETEWHLLGTEELDVRTLGLQESRLKQYLDLDFWILGELHSLIKRTTERLDTYDLTGAARGIGDFVDTLSNWYIRRSRERFWWPIDKVGSDEELAKRAAYKTLRKCLSTVAQLLAPFAPFIAEELWQNLERRCHSGAALSVHISQWPQFDEGWIDASARLRKDMEIVMRVVSLGRAARTEHNIKVRQPLHKVLVQIPDPQTRHAATRYERLICEELNVERVSLLEDSEELVRYSLRPNLPKLGKKYGKGVKPIQDALLNASSAEARRIAEFVLKEQPVEIRTADGPLSLEADEVLLSAHAPEGLAARTEEGVVVAITTEITEALRERGIARELIRAIGELRKQAGCKVSDRVAIGYSTADPGVAAALLRHQEFIERETLSTLRPSPISDASAHSRADLDEVAVELWLSREQSLRNPS